MDIIQHVGGLELSVHRYTTSQHTVNTPPCLEIMEHVGGAVGQLERGQVEPRGGARVAPQAKARQMRGEGRVSVYQETPGFRLLPVGR
jgi:hypothetical protein